MEVEQSVKIAATQMFRVHRKGSLDYPVAMFLVLKDATDWIERENKAAGKTEYVLLNRLS